MAQVLVRELDQEVVDRLKARASRNGRSLEAELRDILERAVRSDLVDAREAAQRIRSALVGRDHSESGMLLSEDRGR